MKLSVRRLAPLVFTLVLGGGALAACSSSPSTPSSSGTTTTATVSTGTSAGSTTAPTQPPAATTTTTSGGPQNLTATPALKSTLTSVYVAARSLPADQVGGTAPGSVYYAFVPSTGTYWAIAEFVPSPTATMQTQVSMQDDGCCGIFTMTQGGTWKFVSGFLGAPCTGQIPADLMTLWNLQAPGDCAPVTTTTT